MDSIFMNSENTRTSEYRVLVLKLTDKLDLRRGQKSASLSNLSFHFTWKNIIFAPTWSHEFELPDGSYSISDIQDYFDYILEKYSENVDNTSIRIYVNKIERWLHLKLKMDIKNGTFNT